ncbi:biotin carboxylase N-terminal domain-containing protein [Microtetraspora glauca]|uniref:biotin carboxylase n=1 Tax=Microtetraspora glauca TaxID=1996 RepID=A0ABV3GEV2_MICGL
MFESVLVANRGEIARRIIRTVRRMGLRAAAVYSDADADLPFARAVVEAGLVWIGPAPEAIVRMGGKINEPDGERGRPGRFGRHGHPRAGDRPGGRRTRRCGDRPAAAFPSRSRRTTCPSAPSCWTTRSSRAGTTTPGWCPA